MQRYFLTTEATYETLRQSLNTQLSYPNSLGKSVFQTALYAPRDGFRRVLLAVDTAIANYAAITAAIAPLLDSDAMEEIDEATYLAAVASATAGASAWDDITGKPSTFAPSAHKSSHATGGSDALTPADIGASAVGHAHSALTDITGLATVATSGSAADLSGTLSASRLPSTTVTAGSYGSASSVATLTVDAAGRLTAAGSTAIAISASQITSGIIASARLGSGTADATTFLRGDQTYSAPVTYATTAQAQDITATSVVLNPARAADGILNWQTLFLYGAATTNGGTTAQLPTWPARYMSLQTSTTTNGTALFPGVGTPAGAYSLQGVYSGQATSAKNWAVPQAFWIRSARGASAANSVYRVQWAEKNAANTFAQMNGRGIGFEIRDARLWLICHNGTSLTQYDTGLNVTGGSGNSSVPFDILLTSSGGTLSFAYSTNGNVTTGSTTGAPTSTGSATSFFCVELTNGASATACTFFSSNPLVTAQ